MRFIDKVYVGVRMPPADTSGEGLVLVIDHGDRLSYLTHICTQKSPRAKAHLAKYGCHSPDGFNWGYGGSGPAELALMLLLDLGISDERAWAAHQRLKSEIIAGLDQAKPWTLTARRLRGWLETFEHGSANRQPVVSTR